MGFRPVPRAAGGALAETRTFARLCASLTEEAEAIGWYQQRLALESDRSAAAIMRDAQGEEFKHFCMDIEFLLRRTPLWREIARGILFQEGDIVEHGEAAEEARRRGRGRSAAPAGGARITGNRKPEGSTALSHLLREHAPITAAGWARIDQEARERLNPGSPRGSWSTSRDRCGWQYSATNLGTDEPLKKAPFEGTSAVRRRVLPLVELRADFALTRASCRRRPRRRGRRLRLLDAAAHRPWHGGERGRVPRLAGGRHPRHRRGLDQTPIPLGDDCERYPRHVATAVERCCRTASTGRTASR